jgi:Zn-dependent protease
VLGSLVAGGLFLLGKLKFLGLLASVLKFKTLATMLLSTAMYASGWGWPFAAGFVLLIFVHELGHAIVLKHEGIPAGAPVFIPFLGAFIAMKGRPRDAYVEAKVAIGGPVLGSLAAWAVLGAGLASGRPFLVTLGHTGIMLNLFNLIPVSPLDGGRIAGVFTRGFWIAGYALGVLALVVTRSPILFLVLLVGLFTLWQRWRNPVPGYDNVPGGKRLAMGLAFAALVIALVLTLPLGMRQHPGIGG